MTIRPALALTLLLFAAVVSSRPFPAPPGPAVSDTAAPASRIVVSYFHGDLRCATCRKLETYAREAIETSFPAELASGRLVFQAVNTDRPENRHFVADYALLTRALVVTEEADGKVVRWTNLEKIWRLVGDHQAYTEYVVAGVRSYLGPRP
jgi:hypothetical protein